jgi:hypothetical protein
VPALLPGTAEEAVAAWTPTPGSLTDAQVLPQARVCGSDVGDTSSTRARGVTRVDLALDNGQVVQASVKSGWWAAWWPGPEGGEVDRLTVIVHNAGGTASFHPSQLS